MNRHLRAILVGLILLASCKSQQEIQTFKESRIFGSSDTWVGTYTGTVPCADCQGIRTVLTMNKDLSYVLRTKYLGKSDDVHISRGEFGWTPEGNVIVLTPHRKAGPPVQYVVGESSVTQLAVAGRAITGALADRYILQKVVPGITGKIWTLKELHGTEVPAPSSSRDDVYIMLKEDENRITGNGGCNTFGATYELREGSRIKISNIAATRKACREMKIEYELFKVLELADTFTLRGDLLILGKGPSSRLAVFEPDYMK